MPLNAPVAPAKSSTTKAIRPGLIAPLSCVEAARAPTAALPAAGLAIRTPRRRWPGAIDTGTARCTAPARPRRGVTLTSST